jgi:hypothetical protein
MSSTSASFSIQINRTGTLRRMPCRRATTAKTKSGFGIALVCVRHYCRHRRNCRRLNGKSLWHLGAQHSAGDFDDHYRRLLQSGRPLDLDHEKIGSGAGHFFHRLRSSRATIPCNDWHRSLDRRRRNQDRHWRLDCASPLSATGRRVEKVRLDRASGGERRVQVAVVHELVEFGTIPGNA